MISSTSMRKLLLIVGVMLAAALVLVALAAPRLGLGTKEDFVLYSWLGLSRSRLASLGLLLLAVTAIAAIAPMFRRSLATSSMIASLTVAAKMRKGTIRRVVRLIRSGLLYFLFVAIAPMYAGCVLFEAWYIVQTPYAERWDRKVDAIRILRRSNAGLYPSTHIFGLIADPDFKAKLAAGSLLLPLSNLSRSSVLGGNEQDGWIVIQTDRYGFNNPDKVWDSREVDFLLLGDSYTMPCCVPYEFGFAGRLAAKGRSVLNLGMDGAGPFQMLAALTEYGGG